MACLERMASGYQAEPVGQVACPPFGVLARYPDEELGFPSIQVLLFLRACIFLINDVNFEKHNFELSGLSYIFSGTTVGSKRLLIFTE